MHRFAVFSATIFVAILAGALYGILHDQVTYTISPEYYTKFKFPQFGFHPEQFSSTRAAVAMVGFLATWWMGLFTGVILGLVALSLPDHRAMRKALVRSFAIVLMCAILFGIAGYIRGRFLLPDGNSYIWIPAAVKDRHHFLIAGSIHNFSYLGGVAGIFAGVFVLSRFYRNYRSNINPSPSAGKRSA